MKFISLIKPLLLMGLLFFAEISEATTDKYRIMWRADPATTMVIGWNQVSGSSPVVHYGTTDQGTNASAYTNTKTPDRVENIGGIESTFARLTGLQPNTAYYFVIKDSQGTSERFWFKTTPNVNTERLSFIAGGDSRNNREVRVNANKLVAKLRSHAVLFGGDFTLNSTISQWADWLDDWQYTIGADGRMTPIIVTRGNHEAGNNNLLDYFDLPNDNVYYALTFGDNLIRAYTLNTEISIAGNQTNWLANDLATSDDIIWKTAQYHKGMRPHVSWKDEGDYQYDNWAPLFEEHKVQLVIECDAHTVKTTWPIVPSYGSGSDEGFIRDDSNGTVYVGEGCWGAPLRNSDDNKAWTRASGAFNQFKWIFVDQQKIEVRTIKIENVDAVGQVNDNNIFTTPANLEIWDMGNGNGEVVTIQGAVTSENPCETVQVTTGNGSITISNITAGNTMELRIIGPGTNWSDRTICNDNCSSTVTESGLIAGTYFVKALNSNPGCYAQQQVTVSTVDNPCINQGGDSDNDNVCADVDCDDNNASIGAEQTPGTDCDDGNSNTINDVILADRCTCAGTVITTGNPCQSVVVTTGNGSVTISNITAGNTMELRIIGPGTNWSDRTLCNDNCSSTVTESGLIAGTYFVKALNSNPGCYAQQQVTVTAVNNPCINQGGDSDNDNICGNVDCDDNNASVGAEQTPGTNCDDGNPNTSGDVILADGCTCGGVPDGNACESIQISPGNASVAISNITPTLRLQIIGQGTNWQHEYICNSDCQSSKTASYPPGNYVLKATNSNPGCYAQYDLTISSNKLAQPNDSQPLFIFPNPIKNNRPTLLLDSLEDEELNIQIYNINSQLVHSQLASTISGANEITLDLENAQLASGVYFVKVISEKYTYGATRFVKP